MKSHWELSIPSYRIDVVSQLSCTVLSNNETFFLCVFGSSQTVLRDKEKSHICTISIKKRTIEWRLDKFFATNFKRRFNDGSADSMEGGKGGSLRDGESNTHLPEIVEICVHCHCLHGHCSVAGYAHWMDRDGFDWVFQWYYLSQSVSLFHTKSDWFRWRINVKWHTNFFLSLIFFCFFLFIPCTGIFHANFTHTQKSWRFSVFVIFRFSEILFVFCFVTGLSTKILVSPSLDNNGTQKQ